MDRSVRALAVLCPCDNGNEALDESCAIIPIGC